MPVRVHNQILGVLRRSLSAETEDGDICFWPRQQDVSTTIGQILVKHAVDIHGPQKNSN